MALGLRAVEGGAVTVGVALDAGERRVVLATLITTCDRLSFEPYHVAAELTRDPHGRASAEAAAAVAAGRGCQDVLAAEGLRAILRRLDQAGYTPLVAALLVNRAGWITDLLEYSVAWPEHLPVAEGLAVRDALRFACEECGIDVAELDEKSLPNRATTTLGTSAVIDARLKALGATVAGPWRKEQKLACLAAWFARTTVCFSRPTRD